MPYVIQRCSDGLYVTRPGSLHSYTRKLQDAWFIATKDAAEAQLCIENERVARVPDSENLNGIAVDILPPSNPRLRKM